MANVAQLRSLRNAVIGSRTKKSELVAQGRVPSLVALLADPEAGFEVQSLAATIVGSLARAAPPPTLLSLCRAQTTEALLASLSQLVDKPGVEVTTGLGDLRLIESLLRALRSLLVALADVVSPGSRWERGLGLSSRLDVGSNPKGKSLSAMGKSSREIVGWHIADAGFELDGDTRMSSASTDNLREQARRDTRATSSPQEELIVQARSAIGVAFQAQNLPFWLGTLFIAKLPTTKNGRLSKPSSQHTSHTNSRSSTRPASPALVHLTGSTMSRSSSHMSTSSRLKEDTPSPNRSSTPIMSNQVRLLSITEMVLGTLSSCLAISGSEDCSPGESLSVRRREVLDFVASDSPFWQLGGGGERARAAELDDREEPMQASFVKQGKSTDERRRADGAEESGLMMGGDEDSIRPDIGVLDLLLEATECGYAKTQEAALWALTDLSRENTDTSRRLFSCSTPSGQIPTSMLLNLRRDSSAPLRLAAFCCLAHIIKVHPFTPRTNECVLSVLAELIDFPGDVQVAAIFALARLLADDPDLEMMACEQYDCIDKLAKLLDRSRQGGGAESMVDEHLIRLREASLTALAALCFQRDEIRRRLVDHTTPTLLPFIVSSLSVRNVGVRIAASRLVRALSRSISILRTSLVDAGVAAKLLAILQNKDEDDQVKVEATASICNLVLNFSPMKQVLMEGGGIAKLVELANSSHGPTRLNALWALKNVLYSSDLSVKKHVMETLQWTYVFGLAKHAGEVEVQEQALNIIRNVCSSREEDVEIALEGFGGASALLDLIEGVIWQRRNDNVLEQAAFILVNIATGSEDHRRLLINRPNLLDALVFFVNHPRPELREAGIWAVTNLTQPLPRSSPSIAMEAVDRLKSFHFDDRLKELIDDPERDVSDRAKGLLSRFS